MMNALKRTLTLRRVLSCLVLTACALAIAVLAKCSLPTRVPPDQELIVAFRDHRRSFEQIQSMAAEDMRNGLPLRWHREIWWCPGAWWCQGSTKPPGMPVSRWEDYRSLISRIRPRAESVTINYDGGMSFDLFRGGRSVPAGVEQGNPLRSARRSYWG